MGNNVKIFMKLTLILERSFAKFLKILSKSTLVFQRLYENFCQNLYEISISIGNWDKIFLILTWMFLWRVISKSWKINLYLKHIYAKLCTESTGSYNKTLKKLTFDSRTFPLEIMSKSSWNWLRFCYVCMHNYVQIIAKITLIVECFYRNLCQNLYEILIDLWAIP